MSDIYANAHKWERGDSLQWGAMNLPSTVAQTPFRCALCGASFVHYYHQQPNIYKAIAEAGIDNSVCQSTRKEGEKREGDLACDTSGNSDAPAKHD